MGGLGTRHDYKKHRGDEYDISFTVVDDDGDPVDISAAATTDLSWGFATLDTTQEFPAPLGALIGTAKTIGSGITIIDGVNGDAQVTLESADTNGQGAGKYYHELQYTDPTGRVSTILYGIMELVKDLHEPGPT